MKTDSPFEIGSMFNDWQLHGLMDDVQIYEVILTDEEVTSLFNEPGSAIGLPPTLTGDYNGNGDAAVYQGDDTWPSCLGDVPRPRQSFAA